MKRLTTEQVLALHRQLIVASGGMDGIRDKGLVES
ncbi:TPA: type II toxin-antitoxin system death-on-curing family toxin, partial [Streptococcus pneumoniae]|nr:type II toxin-antitoxin system death-on-curing family toxin [Streptococcus pneumoniae]